MQDKLRAIVIGAAVGALLGALGGWLYQRYGPRKQTDAAATNALVAPKALDRGKLMRLGVALVGVIRQLMDLD